MFLYDVDYCPWVVKLLIPSVLEEGGGCDICPCLKLLKSRLTEALQDKLESSIAHGCQSKMNLQGRAYAHVTASLE